MPSSRRDRLVVGSSVCLALLMTLAGSHVTADETEKPAAPALSRLTGVVRWADGRALGRLELKLYHWDEDRKGWQAAEKTAAVDADGRFVFEGIAGGKLWCVEVRAPGAGLTLRQLEIKPAETRNVSVTLRPPAAGYVVVRDEQGRPLAGARLAGWECIDGNEGSIGVGHSAPTLGLAVPVSDDSGRLALPELPEGVVLKWLRIEHPEYVGASLKPDARLVAGQIASCVLPTGFPLRFHFVDPASNRPPPDLGEVEVFLDSNQFENPNEIGGESFSVRDGRVETRIQPTEFCRLFLNSKNHFFTPQLLLRDNAQLQFAPGVRDNWTFRALRKVRVRGRVVKTDGTPVAGANLRGDLENLLGDGSPAPKDWRPWASGADNARTDEQGEYSLQLAPGHSRIVFRGPGIPATDTLAVTIEGTAERRIPDIVVRELPRIRGTVLGVDGQPARGAVVRVFSESLRGEMLVTQTDEQGAFEFVLSYLPHSFLTEEPAFEHRVFAYLPHESIGGVATIDLHDAKAAGAIAIRMTEQPVDWPLSAMRDAFIPWELGQPDERSRKEWIRPDNAGGAKVPELDGSLWLNTGKRSLVDFRGQFVLLDFYTTWCGPCAMDFPTVKLVHDLFHDHGLAVIAVHDSSSTHEVIRQHAANKGMEMPIAVDQDDGRILNAYRGLALVSGFPSYVLLDPEGRLIAADQCTPAPLLRNFKIELARQCLLQRGRR